MANDLLCLVVKASARTSGARPFGEQRALLVWVKPGAADVQAQIKPQLAERGWDVIEVRDTKPVSSADHGGDENIRRALDEARQSGFAYVVYSVPPQ